MALDDLFTGALTHGVNATTFAILNALLLAATLALGGLLAVSWSAAPALVPHAAFLLLLALGLWASIVWFIIGVVGLVDPEQQRRELGGGGGGQGSSVGADTAAADRPPASGEVQEGMAGSKKLR